MFSSDSLFVDYDKKLFDAYKDASLVSGDYFGHLERILGQNATESEHTVQKYSNPIDVIVAGPASNIAGRYRSYLGGQDDFLPQDKISYGSRVQSFKPSKVPNTKDLATGWAVETTDDLLYPW